MGYCVLACSLVLWFVMASHTIGLSMVEDQELCSSCYDYRDALAKAILFFEGQRSGKLPTRQRVTWRGDSALSDGKPDNVNLRGGYYDAGDNVKFVWPMAYTVSLLSWTALEYQREISSIHQLGYLRRAIRWGSNFILRANTSPTILYTQVGDGNADHQCWERPEDMDTTRTLYKITSDSPGTEAAAEAAAALSAASMVFKGVDSNYSTRLLRQSKSLFNFADNYRGSYSGSCPFYCSYSSYQDELLWAAAWLYKASGDSKYLTYVLSNQGWSQAVSEFSWDNKFAGAQTLLAKEFHGGKNDLSKFKSDAESFVCALMPGSSSIQIKTTPCGLLYTRDGSNLQYVTSSSMLLFIYSKILDEYHLSGVQCGFTLFSAPQIKAFAKSQVDYILGNNPMQMAYMVGFGSKYPNQVHHRGASIPSIHAHPNKVGCNDGYSSYYTSSNPNPNTHMGSIVGGPDINDHFNDLRSDYSHSEPTTYMNAAFVGSVAALLAT
ncbi:Glyco_hydro_9 domain-containing protein [Cephalotus follicularis]|uniref:Endoglucanase n=1 Tax=Cephalotus follicularis TaxID=3775 RepID=A0A1Q3C7I3_CEPFO|nr:Glyco_hydro_9 domain-containing protein [Cephalotus follicularis]